MTSFHLYRNSNSQGLPTESCHLIPAASYCQLPCFSPTGPSVLAKGLPTPAPALRGRLGQTLPHDTICVSALHSRSV